jgi:hypothetical protein
MDTRTRGSKIESNFLGNNQDYNLYDKSYLKKSKKVLTKVEENRSKSGQRPNIPSRNVSPINERNYNPNLNMVDTRKYVRIELISSF